ncbi:MAG: FHA domain-containing protein [Actinomycetes bacterium]
MSDSQDSEQNSNHTQSFSYSDLNAEEQELSAEVLEAVAALPSGSALLVVNHGAEAGSRFLLDKEVTTAGRHPNADIFLDDVTVSRRHAEFLRVGNTFQVRDLGSLNGTYYDGVRIESALLHDGNEVQVGKYHLIFLASRKDLGS